MDDRRSRKRLLVWSIVATLALYVIPFGRFVAYPLFLLSTLAHELGHGLTATLTGGDFESFQLWFDGSGLAQWRPGPGTTRLDVALIAAGGLVGPAIAAAVLFVVARWERASRLTLGLLAALLGLAEILVVRNAFGLVFVAAVAATLAALAWKLDGSSARSALVFLGVQLALAVFSRSDYLFTATARMADGPRPSDVAIMSAALGLPYWLWGLLCGLFSVATLLAGVFIYLRSFEGRVHGVPV